MWTFIAEIYPHLIRGKVMAVVIAFNWGRKSLEQIQAAWDERDEVHQAGRHGKPGRGGLETLPP